MELCGIAESLFLFSDGVRSVRRAFFFSDEQHLEGVNFPTLKTWCFSCCCRQPCCVELLGQPGGRPPLKVTTEDWIQSQTPNLAETGLLQVRAAGVGLLVLSLVLLVVPVLLQFCCHHY